KRPDALMVPPSAATDHAGVMVNGAPAASRPAAVNCCAAPGASVAVAGVTAIDASVGVEGVPPPGLPPPGLLGVPPAQPTAASVQRISGPIRAPACLRVRRFLLLLPFRDDLRARVLGPRVVARELW